MKAPNLKKNFLYSIFNQLFIIGSTLIVAPYISRTLGAGGVGIQSYTASIQLYFSMAAALGTSVYGERVISQSRDCPTAYSKLFWEIEFMTVMTSIVCMAFWFILIIFSKQYQVYYFILTFNILATMIDITWFFSGLEQFNIIVMRNVVLKFLGIIMTFLFVKTADDLWIYIVILAATALFSSISLWAKLPKYLVGIDFRTLKIFPHFRKTLVYFLPTIASSVYTLLDKTLIGLITHDEIQNGCYEQAEKIISLLKSIVFVALNSVVGTRCSYLASSNRYDQIKQNIKESLHYIFFMGVGCMCGVTGIAKQFVPFFFGNGYDMVIYLLYILGPIVVIIGISSCLGTQYYTPAGRRPETTKYIVVGAVVNFSLNMVMIPKFGAYGAAVASVIAEIIISTIYLKKSGGIVGFHDLSNIGGKKIIAGIVMVPIVYLIGEWLNINAFVTLAIQIIMGIIVYVLVLFVLKDKWLIGRTQKAVLWMKKRFT